MALRLINNAVAVNSVTFIWQSDKIYSSLQLLVCLEACRGILWSIMLSLLFVHPVLCKISCVSNARKCIEHW